MIFFNVVGFLACFHGITLLEITEFKKVEICFNQNVCVGSYNVCKPKEEVKEKELEMEDE